MRWCGGIFYGYEKQKKVGNSKFSEIPPLAKKKIIKKTHSRLLHCSSRRPPGSWAVCYWPRSAGKCRCSSDRSLSRRRTFSGGHWTPPAQKFPLLSVPFWRLCFFPSGSRRIRSCCTLQNQRRERKTQRNKKIMTGKFQIFTFTFAKIEKYIQTSTHLPTRRPRSGRAGAASTRSGAYLRRRGKGWACRGGRRWRRGRGRGTARPALSGTNVFPWDVSSLRSAVGGPPPPSRGQPTGAGRGQ